MLANIFFMKKLHASDVIDTLLRQAVVLLPPDLVAKHPSFQALQGVLDENDPVTLVYVLEFLRDIIEMSAESSFSPAYAQVNLTN
jgi:hypothetical protein